MAPMAEAVVLVNPASGSGTEIVELERAFPSCRVEPCPPDQLAETSTKTVGRSGSRTRLRPGSSFAAVAGYA
jgi:hypothetical protein